MVIVENMHNKKYLRQVDEQLEIIKAGLSPIKKYILIGACKKFLQKIFLAVDRVRYSIAVDSVLRHSSAKMITSERSSSSARLQNQEAK